MYRWDPDLLSWSNIFLLSELLFAYYISLILYRLFFHPLRKFPGEKLAAISGWHWDIHASEPDFLVRLHKIYGPVVRIAPNELHFSQPTAHADIYSTGSKFSKDPQYYAAFPDNNLFTTTDPQEAKVRKEIMGPLFSRRAILKLENVIQRNVDLLVTQMISHSSQPVDLRHAFWSTTIDIITSYCFAESWSTLTYPSFQHPIPHMMAQQRTAIWMLHAFPILWNFFPLWAMTRKSLKSSLDLRKRIGAQIDELLKNPETLEGSEHETIYHHLIKRHPDKGRQEIPPRNSLVSEGIGLVVAGSETVASTATVGVFHVLWDNRINSTLIKELEGAWPDKDVDIKFEVLEKLPYLTAVIKESLRLFSGAVSPLPRIVGPLSARIAGVDVPAGTSVSISSPFLHQNPDIFHDPSTFIPERWLQSNSRELENFLVPFSRGPRSCIGINLAWCELYLIFGNIFRKLDMEVYNTRSEDIKHKEYFFLPVFAGKSLQAKIKKRSS